MEPMIYKAGSVSTEGLMRIVEDLEVQVTLAKLRKAEHMTVRTYDLDAALDYLRQVKNVRNQL